MIDDFTAAERAAVYRAIAARRDVRAHFVDTEIPQDVLMRVLGAAHMAPSVGLSQPWRFILVRDAQKRATVHAAFSEENARAARRYQGEQAALYRTLPLEGILSAPLNICVVAHDAPEHGSGLGRRTMPETTRYSTVCAIQNLWLAARVEGLGVGWVSILDPQALRELFAIPAEVALIGYLCVGYTSSFAGTPDLERAGWESRLPLEAVIDHDRYQG